MWWVVAVVALVVFVATYLTWTAARVERLHARAQAAAAALDAHLVRRAAAADRLAEAVQLPQVRWAARMALEAVDGEREATENDLTRVLRELINGASGAADRTACEEVVAASRRVALARQMHTDLVRDALVIRRRPVVRVLRLARRQTVPAYFDIDDPNLAA